MDFDTADAIRQGILAENDPVTAAIILGQMFATEPEFYAALHGREIAPGVHISNPGPDAGRMAARYQQGVGNAAGRYVEGMQNPRRDPKAAALRAKGKWANQVQNAIQNDLFAKGIQGYDQAEAVQIATSDGGAAFTAGAAKRVAKVSRVFGRLAPLLGGVSQAIQNMPQDTDAQREARALAAIRAMRAVGKQLKGA